MIKTHKLKKMKIKKGDQVIVIAGKDRGKEGKVEKVMLKEGKIVVAGINIIKKHIRPSSKYPKGGIIEMPSPIDVSNVMLKCPHCQKATRVGYIFIKKDDKKSRLKRRICKKCKQQIDKE